MKLCYLKHKTIRNFGDDLNAYLWEKIFPGIFDEDDEQIFIGIGTILNEKIIPRAKKKIVFGTGVGYGTPPEIDHTWKIYCLRGPLSAKLLHVPTTFAITDGAVLIKQVYKSISKKTIKYSVMPHITQATEGGNTWGKVCNILGFQYIDPQWPIETVMQAIARTEYLLTESLHGAIVADVLRVPWWPIVAWEYINIFKWNDWCASMNIEYKPSKILPLWNLPPNSNIANSMRRKIKMKLVERQIIDIIKNSRPCLSSDKIFNLRFEQLQQKCDLFREDLRQGVFKD